MPASFRAIPPTGRDKEGAEQRPFLLDRLRRRIGPYCPPGSRLLVAVSGGPDSVALLDLLKRLPYDLVVAHIDHGLRRGSSRDALFVRRLARQYDLPFASRRIPVRSYRRAAGLGIEEAARHLRYDALRRMARRFRCRAVVTAHNLDDQAETVLLNFLRGAGPAGLAGMPFARRFTRTSGSSSSDLFLLRPALEVSRAEIRAYLASHRRDFRIDPTNRSLRFRRNRIRHVALPYLEREFAGVSRRLSQAADIFREEEAFWQRTVERELPKTVRKHGKMIVIDLRPLLGYHKALGRRILRYLLPGLSFQEIERLFQLAQTPNRSDRLQLAGGLLVTKEANRLVVSRRRSGRTAGPGTAAFLSRGTHEQS